MAKIEKFEDILSWQTAREAAKGIYLISSVGEFSRDFALKDQIRHSSISIMPNIAEGFEREGNKEFINFSSIAKGSCAEARSQLYVAFDQNYINSNQFELTYTKLDETGRLIGGFMNYLNQSDFKGNKFR